MANSQWLSKAILVVVSLLVGVGLFEASVRIFRIDHNINLNWRYHPVIGWSQVPNGKYNFLRNGKKIHIEFNSKGFHDIEHSFSKPQGTRRIVLVGDSFCESVQVNLEDTFYRRLEVMLNRSGKDRWDVINLGVGDFGTTQEWVALTQLGAAYSPDVVICEIFPLNDICNNTIELCDMCKSTNDHYRPYFVLSNGELNLSSAQPVRNFLRRHFVSYSLVEYWIQKIQKRDRKAESEKFYVETSRRLGLESLGPALYTYVDDREQPEVVAKGWKLTEMILEKMASWCRERNVQFIPLVVPFEACVDAKRWAAFASQFPPPRMIRDYPEQRLARLSARLKLPIVLLNEPFEKNRDVVFPFIGGHFNPEGHRVTAEAIYAKMVELNLTN